MTPERRKAIIRELAEADNCDCSGCQGEGYWDPDVPIEEYEARVTEDRIALYDVWLRNFPA